MQERLSAASTFPSTTSSPPSAKDTSRPPSPPNSAIGPAVEDHPIQSPTATPVRKTAHQSRRIEPSAGQSGTLTVAAARRLSPSPSCPPLLHPAADRTEPPPARPHRQRTLRVAHDSPTRLVRSAQPSRCHDCGNRNDWYTRTDNRPISLHPHELDATAVPAASRWHVSSGIAHPADDGTPWCRISHLALCPARNAPTPLTPQIAALRGPQAQQPPA